MLSTLQFDKATCKRLLVNKVIWVSGYEITYYPAKWFSLRRSQDRAWAGFSNMRQYMKSQTLDNLNPVNKAIKAQLIGEEVYTSLVELGLNPKSLTSPIATFEKEIMKDMDLPAVDDMPEEVGEMAYNCCKGTWTEAFKKGTFDHTWDYDMRSAYGSFTAELYDIRYGDWIQNTGIVPRAAYGFCKVMVDINSAFSPILYKDDSKQIFTRDRDWETAVS